MLISDSKIESFLFEQLDKGSIEVTISQISIIYVLRKLIAEKKINSNDICIIIDGNIHSINPTGRFNVYPKGYDLFDKCLDAILSG